MLAAILVIALGVAVVERLVAKHQNEVISRLPEVKELKQQEYHLIIAALCCLVVFVLAKARLVQVKVVLIQAEARLILVKAGFIQAKLKQAQAESILIEIGLTQTRIQAPLEET